MDNRFSKQLYNGFFFSPEREFVQSCLAKSQETVNGRVRMSLLCGNVIIEGRYSDTEKLYDAEQVSMDSVQDFEKADFPSLSFKCILLTLIRYSTTVLPLPLDVSFSFFCSFLPS